MIRTITDFLEGYRKDRYAQVLNSDDNLKLLLAMARSNNLGFGAQFEAIFTSIQAGSYDDALRMVKAMKDTYYARNA
jgi:hypothetical protein